MQDWQLACEKVIELRYSDVQGRGQGRKSASRGEEDGRTDRQNCCRWNRETRTRVLAVGSDALLLGCAEQEPWCWQWQVVFGNR
jgi:hypothetical protein